MNRARVTPHLKINPGMAQWAVQALGRLFATFALLQGLNIVVGGEMRWSSPAFLVALLLPGAPASWGAALALAGAFALYGSLRGRHRMAAGGQWAISAWSVFFSVSFAVAASRLPTTSTTGIYSYAAIAIATAVIGAVYLSSTAVDRLVR